PYPPSATTAHCSSSRRPAASASAAASRQARVTTWSSIALRAAAISTPPRPMPWRMRSRSVSILSSRRRDATTEASSAGRDEGSAASVEPGEVGMVARRQSKRRTARKQAGGPAANWHGYRHLGALGPAGRLPHGGTILSEQHRATSILWPSCRDHGRGERGRTVLRPTRERNRREGAAETTGRSPLILPPDTHRPETC